MIQDLVIHLGDCKTGTTSIQTCLAEGRCSVEQGLCYPTAFNHIPVAKALISRNKTGVKGKFSALQQAFVKSDAAIGIISAEHFEYVEPERLAHALKVHMPKMEGKVRLIAYVRPHAERLVASFAERTKLGGFSGDMQALYDIFDQKGLLDYAPRFRKWRAVFGEAFTLRAMIPSELAQNDVVHDFMSYVTHGGPYSIIGPTRVNETLSLKSLAILRLAQQCLQRSAQDQASLHKQFGRGFARLLGAGVVVDDASEKPALHRDLVETVIARYAADAKALDAEFFQGTPMTTALQKSRDRAVDLPQSARIEDYLDAEAIAQHSAWAEMISRILLADPTTFAAALRTPEHREREAEHRAAMRPKRRRAKAED